MADWRQIQARIRRAKSGKDAIAKLTALFERFRDGMVAYELGAAYEKQEARDEAVRWYTTAAQRFRRADWKQKAAESLERLGAPVPPAELPPPAMDESRVPFSEPEQPALFASEPAAESLHAEAEAVAERELKETAAEVPTEGAPAAEGLAPRKRRRGRRGGRRHRRKREGQQPAAQPPQRREAATPPPPPRRASEPRPPRRAPDVERRPPPRMVEEEAPPASLLEELAQARGRPGEPALGSRLARLEAQLRRLLAGTLHNIEDTDVAPAGPGVLLLSDSDQVTHYYVEPCETIRIALDFLLRGGKRRQASGPPLKGRLAEHLGISESKVGDYVKRHCTVRWLQLDEGAAHLAHFAIAVLKPALND